jgi:hypothetical protein
VLGTDREASPPYQESFFHKPNLIHPGFSVFESDFPPSSLLPFGVANRASSGSVLDDESFEIGWKRGICSVKNPQNTGNKRFKTKAFTGLRFTH